MTTSRCQPMPRFTQLRDSASLICSFWAAPCPASRQPAPVKRRRSRRLVNAKKQASKPTSVAVFTVQMTY